MKRMINRCCLVGVLMAWAAVADAAIQAEQMQVALPEVKSCDGNQRLELTVGLPPQYPQPRSPEAFVPRAGFDTVCVSIARGNPYQLLSWLENSHLQVVVLPQFAVDVLRRSSPLTFESDYVVLEESPLRPAVRLRRPRLDLAAADGSVSGDKAFAKLFGLLEERDGQLDEGDGQPKVMLPHHLSMAVDHLLSRAVAYADTKKLTGEARKLFFTRLLVALSFREPLPGVASTAKADFEYLPVPVVGTPRVATQAIDRDVLVIHRHIVSSYPELQKKLDSMNEASVPSGPKAAFKWLEKPGDRVLQNFYDDNYGLHEYGSVSRRYFRFSIPELWGLLAKGVPADTTHAGDGGLALVLTGGGVKAAYQTRLVEHLYQTGRLRNSVASEPPAAEAANGQDVNYVIGTSGGALLGIFVSALDDNVARPAAQPADASLTSVLWGRSGQRIRSWDIFPPWDLMRYASFVACLIVLLIVGSVAVHFGAKHFAFARAIRGQEVDDPLANLGRRERWPIGNLPWVLLLVLAPLIIVGTARNRGLEHIPAWSGVLYLFIVLIAIDVDQRFSPTGQKLELRKLRVSFVSVACLLAGIAMIWISLGYHWQESVCDDWSRAVVWCTTGFALLALALHRFSADQQELFTTEPPLPFLAALALAVGVVAATYLALLAGMSLGKVAILELTTQFWIWAIAASAVFSILLMILATLRTESGPRFSVINRGVGLLFSRHPSRRWIVGRRRLGRFVLYGLAGWLWWNLVAAPGLYGNCDAWEYFGRTYGNFVERSGRGSGPLKLSVPFVVTATSLQKSQERYFLFPRKDGGEQGGIQSDVWFRLVSDPRWLVVNGFTDLDLQNVAFASGSPFPVFSSHTVALTSQQFDEKFIDGGFAHNRPLDAARALGARRVLVLNSSPLTSSGQAGKCRLGELACNLPKLIPYLWERSQTEDNLSSVTMFVASIYPTPMEGRAWPMLTDFHGDVVDTMIGAADEDAVRRIGVVESWGAPKLEDARMVIFNLSSVGGTPQSAQ